MRLSIRSLRGPGNLNGYDLYLLKLDVSSLIDPYLLVLLLLPSRDRLPSMSGSDSDCIGDTNPSFQRNLLIDNAPSRSWHQNIVQGGCGRQDFKLVLRRSKEFVCKIYENCT